MSDALILDIQRMSTEDGPGLRTTVFFKGCSLACAWCHNPESIAAKPYVELQPQRCMGCEGCAAVCPLGDEYQPAKCIFCEKCVQVCPTGARKPRGERWGVEALFRELMRDRAYFGKEGGVSVSGGEALLQREALVALLKLCRNAGISTALDTAGMVAWSALEEALPYTDILLYDIKLMDEAAHIKYTAQSNAPILENFVRAAALLPQTGTRLWVRTPIIPGATDSDNNIRDIAQFLAKHAGEALERWELCAFNNLCRDKYLRLQQNWEFKDTALMNHERMQELLAIAQEYFPCPERISFTGATKAK